MLKLISNLTFLHSIYSFLINLIPGFLIHNTSKYIAIKKVLINLWIDQIQGDCIEFGIFTGSSFKHTIRTEKKINRNNKDACFYGLDSFEGFPDNDHPFFQDVNFKSSFKRAKKIENKFRGRAFVFKGYFSDSLSRESKLININKLKFVNIDCDLYISSIEPIDFIIPRLSKGAYIIIDDFTNQDPEGNSIRNLFYDKFKNHNFQITNFFGIDGVVIRYFGLKNNS